MMISNGGLSEGKIMNIQEESQTDDGGGKRVRSVLYSELGRSASTGTRAHVWEI